MCKHNVHRGVRRGASACNCTFQLQKQSCISNVFDFTAFASTITSNRRLSHNNYSIYIYIYTGRMYSMFEQASKQKGITWFLRWEGLMATINPATFLGKRTCLFETQCDWGQHVEFKKKLLHHHCFYFAVKAWGNAVKRCSSKYAASHILLKKNTL